MKLPQTLVPTTSALIAGLNNIPIDHAQVNVKNPVSICGILWILSNGKHVLVAGPANPSKN